jgi:hypothetical protein
MAIRNKNVISLEGLETITIERHIEYKIQSIEDIILNFFSNIPKIPKRDQIIAKNQILSLYRRMKHYPEKIALNNFYVSNILQIIDLQEGKVK